jgi:hypothetical protein
VAAQHLLHDRLRYLLPGLGETVIALGRQPEGALEVSDPPPGQGPAERCAPSGVGPAGTTQIPDSGILAFFEREGEGFCV